MIALIAAGTIGMGFLAWQTKGSVGDRDVAAYRLTPPPAFNNPSDSSIVDPVKLREPFITDEDLGALVRAARSDHATLASLNPSYEQVLDLIGSPTIANQLLTQLNPLAQALAGASAEPPSFEVLSFDGIDAVIGVRATYVGPAATRTSVRLDLGYTKQDERWVIAGASVGEGIG